MGSPSAAKQVVEKQQTYGLNPLVDTPAVPMTTEIDTSSLQKHPFTGCKRTKLVVPANLASSSVLCLDPCQTKQLFARSIMFDRFLPSGVLLVVFRMWGFNPFMAWLAIGFGICFIARKSIAPGNLGAGQLLGASGSAMWAYVPLGFDEGSLMSVV
ncbi:hypothetical protein NC653_007324 [Populus alba x Populus x berolinensis]|uniref:Uncharacterized protein n=1 Tax=Populus alba x Populus x berolinensis TaxID=444605 RepID=A0AAD6RGM5_9ROSI|nr:hypothetical protein NC653_007324 [Populus alba x Populus x berolinensis]